MHKQVRKSAFIWYHADAELAETLGDWVHQTGQSLGVSARLMVRCLPDKTTFMEIYELSQGMQQNIETIVELVERRATRQAWFVQLGSPRRAEVFTEAGSDS